MNASHVPYAGIAVTLGIYFIGVILNYLLPSQVFEIVLNVASLGILSTWAFIVVCQMKLRQAINRGEIPRVAFRMPFAPASSWLTLAFLLAVLVLTAFDYPDGTFTVAALPVIAILLCLGWVVLKGSSPFSPTAPSYALTERIDAQHRDPR